MMSTAIAKTDFSRRFRTAFLRLGLPAVALVVIPVAAILIQDLANSLSSRSKPLGVTGKPPSK